MKINQTKLVSGKKNQIERSLFLSAALMARKFEFDLKHFDVLFTFYYFSHVEIKGLTDQEAP
jgi:hypothetical protein